MTTVKKAVRRPREPLDWLPLAPGSTRRTRAQEAFLRLSPAKQKEMFHEITHYSPGDDDNGWEDELFNDVMMLGKYHGI